MGLGAIVDVSVTAVTEFNGYFFTTKHACVECFQHSIFVLGCDLAIGDSLIETGTQILASLGAIQGNAGIVVVNALTGRGALSISRTVLCPRHRSPRS